jgi:hypothetical protein
VISVQVGVAAAAFEVMKTLPSALPVSSVPALGPEPIDIALIQSPVDSIALPVVRSPLIACQPPDPAGNPPVVLRYTRLVPAKICLEVEGSSIKGAMKPTGSLQAGSEVAAQGAARTLFRVAVST